MISTPPSTPSPAACPLGLLGLHERLDLATRLEQRLVEHVRRPGNAEAVRRQTAYVRSESLVPDDVDTELRDAMTRDCAVDMLVHVGPRETGGSLVGGLLDDAPAGLTVTGAERALLVFSPSSVVGVVRGVVGLLTSTPCPAYRNPRTLARARELVADHHRAFRDLFGDVLVQGTASHVMDCYLRFKARIGVPAEEFALFPSLRDERWLPDDAADPDDEAFALVHHPVKGLRLLDWYAQLREVHAAPFAPWKPERLAQVLADPDVPSWVLALLAERHPDHLDALYGAATERQDFVWARDGAALLHDREPAAGRDEPGIVMASSIMGRVLPPGEP